MYESRHSPLLPRKEFYARVRNHATGAFAVLAGSLAIGMLGYHLCEHQGWVDSFANASMILSGMGPLDPVQSRAGRVFAGFYALFSGVTFLTTIGFFLMPVIHRLLHKFHLEASAKKPKP